MICTSCNTGTIRDLRVGAGNGLVVICDNADCKKCFIAKKTSDSQTPILEVNERVTNMLAKRFTDLGNFAEDVKIFPVYE